MRIGVFVSETWGEPSTLGEVAERARQTEALGFASAWVPYLPWSVDAMQALTAAGESTRSIELGSAVIPTYLFHPLALARQAYSLRGTLGDRLTLGVGCSQQVVIEQMHGIPFERPAQHVREYVEILRSAGEGTGHVDFKGELFSIDSIYGTPGAGPMPILVGALGPLMLRAAGEVADGTIATWSDEVAIERVIVPTITAAAAGAGRPAPRVGAVVPVAVTDDEDTARAAAAETFAIYDSLPRYQRMVGLGGCERAADVCAIGSERKVRDRLRGFAAAGLTDFLAAPFAFGDDPEGSRQRTLQSLADLAASL